MSWQTPENLSADGIVDLFTGTPDGTKYLRDDGTLALPSGGSAPAIADITDWPSGLTATELGYVNGVTSAIQTQLDAKLPLAGGTVSGDILHSVDCRIGPSTSDGADNLKLTLGNASQTRGALLNLYGNEYGSSAGHAHIVMGNANDAAFRVYASDGSTQLFRVESTGSKTTVTFNLVLEAGPLQFNGAASSAGASIANIFRDSTGDLNYNVDTGDVHDFTVNGTSQATIGATGIVFPTTHGTMSTGAFGVWRTALAAILQGPTGTGYAQIGSGASTSAPRIYVSGTTTGYNSGGTVTEGSATSVANAAQKTVLTGATTYSGFAEVVDTTNSRVALYSIEAGVPTKESGHAQFVAGAPGAGEVGLELSTTTLRINNGSGGALLLGCHLRVF